MFEVADRNRFHFDTVQMPVNVMDAHFRSFTREVIPVANDHGTGVLAMKTFGDPFILESGFVDPIDALHWGLSQEISVLIAGIDKPEILDQALRAVRTFQPLSESDTRRILDRTREAALEGKYELFKTSTTSTAPPAIPSGSARNSKASLPDVPAGSALNDRTQLGGALSYPRLALPSGIYSSLLTIHGTPTDP